MDITFLRKLGANCDGVEWAEKQPSLYIAYQRCRADHLLWLAGKLGIDKKLIISAACDCAQTVLHLVLENDEWPKKAIETAREYIAGRATLQNVRSAFAVVDAAFSGAVTFAAISSAYASAASYAASGAIGVPIYVSTVSAASYAASAVSYASADPDAYGSADIDRRQKHLIEMASLIRKRIPYRLLKEKIAAMEGK